MDVRLRACPFREAVLAEGGHLICALHRGLVRGALERIDDAAELAVFEPRHPGHRRLPGPRPGAPAPGGLTAAPFN